MNEEKRLVEVLFKSGSTVRFHCETFKVNTSGGVMMGYEYTGVPSEEQILHLNISDIDCIRAVPER